jgi:hypothetical protein
VRVACFVVFFGLTFSNAFSQNFNAFISAGITTSQVSGDALSGFDKAGFNVGAGVALSTSRKIQISFEPSYLQKGSRKPSKLDKGDPSFYLLRLNYIELPVLISYRLTQSFKLQLGPSIGWLEKSTEEDENGVLEGEPFNAIDLSISGGIAYQLSNNWQLVLRNIQSVSPVREFGGRALPFFKGGQYNTVIAFILQYYFKQEGRK